MATGLIDIMKRAAMDANDASNPTDLRYGTVTKENPLEITVTNTFVLPEEMLIVPETLTDHEIEVTVASGYGWQTQPKSGGSGEASYASHQHDITVNKQFLFVHSGLRVGDRVALIREHGGRKFFVLDRF